MRGYGNGSEEGQSEISSNIEEIMSLEEFKQLRRECREKGGSEGEEVVGKWVKGPQRISGGNQMESKDLYARFCRKSRGGGNGSARNFEAEYFQPKQYSQYSEPNKASKHQSQAAPNKSNHYFEQFIAWKSTHPLYQAAPANSFEFELPKASQIPNEMKFRRDKPNIEESQQIYKSVEIAESEYNRLKHIYLGQPPKLTPKILIEESQDQTQPEGSVHNHPLDMLKQKLKQKMDQLEKLNKQIGQINNTIEASMKSRPSTGNSDSNQLSKQKTIKSQQLSVSDKPTSTKNASRIQNKSFQCIIKNPPLSALIKQTTKQLQHHQQSTQKQSQLFLPKPAPISTPTPTLQIQSSTQTSLLQKRLDLNKILSLNDYHFLEFWNLHKAEMEKIGTPQDLAQIRKRYKEIVNETAVKTMLKKVLEEVPQEKLQRISDGHKERAYEVLYGKQ